MTMMQAAEGIDPAWFGIAMHLHADCAHQTAEYLSYLGRHGFVNRPIINGSFICQPSIAMYCKEEKAENYPGSEAIHKQGFFIGMYRIHADGVKINLLISTMLAFDFTQKE